MALRGWPSRIGSLLMFGALTACGNWILGCTSFENPAFPNQLRNSEGDPILLDDIESIVSDPALTDDEKRTQLRELGLEDEKLIDALLDL